MIDGNVCRRSVIDVAFGLRKSCFDDVVGDGFAFECECEALFDCADESFRSATEPWQVHWYEFPAEDNLVGDDCSESSDGFLSLLLEDVVDSEAADGRENFLWKHFLDVRFEGEKEITEKEKSCDENCQARWTSQGFFVRKNAIDFSRGIYDVARLQRVLVCVDCPEVRDDSSLHDIDIDITLVLLVHQEMRC